MAGTAGIQTTLCVYFNQSAGTAAAQDYTLTRSGTVSAVSAICKGAGLVGGNVVVARVSPGAVIAPITPALAVTPIGARTTSPNIQNQTLVAGDIIRFTSSAADTLVDAFVSIIPPVAGLVNIA